MAEQIKFSKEETENARVLFKELSLLFEKDKSAFLEFKSRPIRFLRESGLMIMKYINNENERNFLNKFSWGIKNILLFKTAFDSCAWCKITALTIIYALCGKARLPIDACWGLLSSIIEAIESILNLSSDAVKAILRHLKSLNDRLSPFNLAKLICENLGYCP